MNADPIRILLVEDNPGDARLFQIALEEAGSQAMAMEHVLRLETALDRLEHESFSAVLLDLSLPDAHGLDTVTRARRAAPHVPIIVLTGLSDQETALRAVQEGAQDYLVKGEVEGPILVRSLRYAIERHRLQAQIQAMSLVDDLSGLYNRRGFMTLAEQQLKIAVRQRRGVALLYADLDGMKQINDRFGHAEGDCAIMETARLLTSTFRNSDIVARLGGDEFAILALDVSPPDVDRLGERLEESVRARNARMPHPYPLAVSVGAVHYDPSSPCSLEELLARADALMYERKRSKPGRRPRSAPRAHAVPEAVA